MSGQTPKSTLSYLYASKCHMLYCHRAWIHSDKVKVGVIVAALVGVVIVLAVIASLAYWYFAKYRNRDQVKYNNLGEVETNEEETLIGDQQL